MPRVRPFLLLLLLASLAPVARAEIPLPEHPRPDFERAAWVNLNGDWAFRFDRDDAGERERWFASAPGSFPLRIRVPYPWGSTLSGVPDEGELAWYARTIRVPDAWRGLRVFVVVGASDWSTSAWLDDEPVGRHEGGYTPFEFELTGGVRPGVEQRLVLRVDDRARPFKLEGKQGYGNARGVWQTVYLEARPAVHVESVEMHPRLAAKQVEVRVRLSAPVPPATTLNVLVTSPRRDTVDSGAVLALEPGARDARLTVPLGEWARPWSLEDPHLYDAPVTLRAGDAEDRVKTYFGLREIGTARLPGSGHPYVALNGRPIYLQMTLDQAWNPDGFWNWPTDEAMREEILIARRLGLNAIRTHVKVEVPRKLY